MGQVHRLAPSSWAKFVQETLGHPVPVNVTRAQFHQLPVSEQRSRKRVQFVTPAAFKTDPAQRIHPNAQSISLVCLDIDDPQQARPFTARPELLKQALEPLAFAAYLTASAKPEAPKLRIMVPADNLAVASYGAAVKHIAHRLGLTTVTKESLVAVQPMYLPTMFRDDDPIEDNPLIIAVTVGPVLLAADVMDAPVTTPQAAPAAFTDDDLDYLRPTVEGITLEDAAKALEHLDSDCTYPEWLEVAAALRHQFYGGEQEQKAYALFDQWSAKGSKYVDSEDTKAKWSSLRPSPRGRAPVTIRSLLHRAAEAGWVATTISGKIHGTVVAWLANPARTGAELLAEGVKRIAAAPLQSSLERASLLAHLRDALTAHGHKVTRQDLKKDMRRLEARLGKGVASTPDTELPKWARGMCYVAGTNEFFIRSADRRLGPEVLDNVYGVHLMEGDSVTGRPPVRPRDFLLNVCRIPRVDHYAYDPSHPEEAFIARGKQRFVNLYLPTYPEPEPEDADAAGEVLLRHVTHLVKESEYRRVLLDYLAYCVQNPGKKIRWAILLQGAQGCGKTALAEVLSAVLGSQHVSMVDASLIFSPFNSWASGAQVVAIEEIRVVGHNRHEVMDRLKPCISNDMVTINGKHQGLRINVPNVTNYLMFTNHHDSLAVGDGDRRYFVINSALQTKAQVVELGPRYFPTLFKTIINRAAGLRAFLEQWGISSTFQANGHAPTTLYLQDLMSASASPLNAAILEAIQDGEHPMVQKDLISSRNLRAMLDTEALPHFNHQTLASALRELGYRSLGRARLGERRHWLWTPTASKTTFEQACELATKRLVD